MYTYEEAAECCRQALRLQPGFASAYNNLGIALYNLQRYEEAADSYRRALERNPNWAEVLNNLGNTRLALRFPAKFGGHDGYYSLIGVWSTKDSIDLADLPWIDFLASVTEGRRPRGHAQV